MIVEDISRQSADQLGHCIKERLGVIKTFSELRDSFDAVSRKYKTVVPNKYARKTNVNQLAFASVEVAVAEKTANVAGS